MVGDRYLTDVVYGNRHGMLTVRCAPFTEEGESGAIKVGLADRCCLPRRRLQFKPRSEGPKCMSVTWQAISARTYMEAAKWIEERAVGWWRRPAGDLCPG
jgi:hypothetical protein